jgi:hypothetical protein
MTCHCLQVLLTLLPTAAVIYIQQNPYLLNTQGNSFSYTKSSFQRYVNLPRICSSSHNTCQVISIFIYIHFNNHFTWKYEFLYASHQIFMRAKINKLDSLSIFANFYTLYQDVPVTPKEYQCSLSLSHVRAHTHTKETSSEGQVIPVSG